MNHNIFLMLSLLLMSLLNSNLAVAGFNDKFSYSHWHSNALKPTFRRNYQPFQRQPSRSRNILGIQVSRPFGNRFLGYGSAITDSQALRWIAFTAITITLLNHLSEEQQRKHEEAQIIATTAAKNESIHWEDGDASGSVKTIRIGISTSGRHCREFQQTITIANKTEQAYGTACLQPDGVWEIIK